MLLSNQHVNTSYQRLNAASKQNNISVIQWTTRNNQNIKSNKSRKKQYKKNKKQKKQDQIK
jgi:hypothetical protein